MLVNRILLVVVGLLTAVWPSLAPAPARAQAQAQALERMPLSDLSAFDDAGKGWRVVGDVWAHWDSPDLETEAGTGVVTVDPGSAAARDLVTSWAHGDLVLELEYLLGRGAVSGILLQGRYEVRIADSWGVDDPTFTDAAGILPVADGTAGVSKGQPPRVNASKAPGLWQHLRIVFEAPRFDDDGRKTADARIVEVMLNGVTVQESVRLSGPTRGAPLQDERASGQLVFAGDGSGGVAFRNIRYRHFEPAEPVMLSDMRYHLRRGEFSDLDEMRAAPLATEGRAAGYVWDLFGRTADRFGITWDGVIEIPRGGAYTFTMRFNWIDEIPYDEDAVAGKGLLQIGGETVVDHTGADSAASGSIHLQEGAHPISISYFKNRRLWRPIVFLRVEGPGMPGQYLNAYRTLPEPESSYPTVRVEPDDEPYILRSFADYDSVRKTNVISVGDPSGVHYAVDADAGSLLTAWKGPFADVGSMWTARGELQNAVPMGQRIMLSGRPTVAYLSGESDPWPASADDLRFDGYTLDEAGRPSFRYIAGDVRVHDELLPEDGGRSIRRVLRFDGEAPQAQAWVLLAAGRDIRRRGQGVYSVDGAYFIEAAQNVQAQIRASGGEEMLVAPARFVGGTASVEYSIVW